MKVKCVASNGSHLNREYYSIGYTSESVFDVSIGSSYTTYAMCVWNGILMYLICDEYNLPNWYPAAIFEIEENTLSPDWKFTY